MRKHTTNIVLVMAVLLSAASLAAQAKARELDIPLSQILRQLLRQWISENERQPEEAEPENE